ncbi:MAG: hypothetical protein BWY67_00598 [Bacteroidetes bacterium ADurb.Bin397]|nr:MAG: hypothetical protein BWY67_00598 [Bacteroidetes bacterium ADurb.Bin397]
MIKINKTIAGVILIFCIHCTPTTAQNRNLIWCFGDSAGINFGNLQNPTPFNTGMDARGSCASIADTNGNLQFYASTSDPFQLIHNELVYIRNSTNQVMVNGDSIVGLNWYQELAITDFPDNSNKFYLFSIGVTNSFGLYYSVIDMNLNGGLGEVIQKNVQLQNFKCSDGLTAVKHGNGRDWWILFRRWDTVNDIFYKYLITPAGISNLFIQNIGSFTNNGFAKMKFSGSGEKFSMITLPGLMELYDFDRCSGVISNPVTIHPEPTTAPFGRFWSCEFSSNGRFLYVATNADTNFLYQYDLQSPNPATSRIILDSTSNYLIGSGFVKRGPDNKIYFSKAYECDAWPYCYPYPDSVYNQYNMNLSVINSPDSLGLACNYTPYSFYLGGKRTYYGLPNNPDYDLPALSGSPCDTLVSQNELAEAVGSLHVYYHPAWEKAFINASNLKGKSGKLLVYDMQGKVVHSEPLRIQNGYFTRDISMVGYAMGGYLITIQTEMERLTKKMMVE